MRLEPYTIATRGIGTADYTLDVRATVPVNVVVEPSAGDIDRGWADDTSTVNQLDDTAKDWAVNLWRGSYVRILAGTGAGQARRIASNTATAVLPVNAFSTAPDSLSEYLIYPSEAEESLVGSPIFVIDRRAITDTDWEVLVRWDIPSGVTGDLGEISVMSDNDAKTRYRVTIAGEDQNVPDREISTPVRIPWAGGNVLAGGSAVVVEVRSTDGTSVTVDALITGTER